MAQLNAVVQNVAAQTLGRHNQEVVALVVLCGLLGSSLFSRPDDWSHWRQAFSALVVRRCRVSELLLLPGCLVLDFGSGSLSCSPALVTSFPALRLFFDSVTWRDIQSAPSRSAPNVLAVEDVGTLIPTGQDSLLPPISRDDLLRLGVPAVRVDSVLLGYSALDGSLRDPPHVVPFVNFYARDLMSYLIGKEAGTDAPRFSGNLPPLDFSIFSGNCTNVFLVS